MYICGGAFRGTILKLPSNAVVEAGRQAVEGATKVEKKKTWQRMKN